MSDKISVIIPIYKVEKYLEKCVNSVMQQTYQNLEIILVDDGSPDNCPQICDELAKKDGRIKVIHKENGGLSSARNAGLDIAQGEYISFIDSDDYVDEHFIEKLYHRIVQDNSDMAFCTFVRVDENENPIYSKNNTNNDIITPEQFWKLGIGKNLWEVYVVSWNKLYKSEIWKNLRFPFGKCNEDEFVIKDVIAQCKKISVLSDALYYYLTRSDSIMGIYNVNRLDGIEACLKRCEYFLENQKKDFCKANLKVCTSALINSYQQLDMKNPKNRERYLELRKYYQKIYKKVFPVRESSKLWLLCTLYYISEKLYLTVLMGYKFLKKSRTAFKYSPLLLKLFFTRNKAVLMLTPLHGNIGDQAITLGEFEYFDSNFHNLKVIEIPSDFISSRFWSDAVLKTVIRKDDLVLINGGGFMGTLWIAEEQRIRKILTALSDRKIVIMPQTIFYDDDENGQKELKISQEVYSQCKNLSIFLREKYSYEFCQKYFPEIPSYLVPDMVLQLAKYQGESQKRNGILLCLRSDKEKTQNADKEIKQALEYLHEDFIQTDTVINHPVSQKQRKIEVDKKLEEFASAKLIVTDRLHGMILAAIAQTPCIVILSKSHKVKGVYEWIKDFDYIELVEDISQIESTAQRVLNATLCYNNAEIKKYYQPLTDKIRKLLQN